MPEHQLVSFLKTVVTPKRLEHSLGVMHVMSELAEVYNLDQEKARIIGILHDAGKDLPPHVYNQLVEEGNIQIQYACEADYTHYLHAPVGSYLVQRELGITDDLILDAITTHTYFGNSQYFNDPLCWCMRFSDLLEPTRNWEGERMILECAKRLREIAYSGKLEEGAFLETGVLIKWFEELGIPVHPNMRQTKQALAVKLGLDDSFLES